LRHPHGSPGAWIALRLGRAYYFPEIEQKPLRADKKLFRFSQQARRPGIGLGQR